MGSDPNARAAVLLPEAHRRDPDRAARRDDRSSLPDADQELPLRGRARRGAGQGRPRRPGRARARSRLWLHGRARHDAARPAARDGRREEAVGDRQELRPLGGAGAAAAGGEDRPLHAGRDLAQGERADEAERQPEPDDLERRRAGRQPVERPSSSCPGDIIYSGTPENVGPVVKGDIMDAHIDGLPDLRVKVV